MSEALYSVGTWDTDTQAFSPQEGLTVPSINVPLATMRQVLRDLRERGYSCHRYRDPDGGHECNDPWVVVERTDGKPLVAILESWDRSNWPAQRAARRQAAKS